MTDTSRFGLLIVLFVISTEAETKAQYPAWNPCQVGCVNCLGCNNVLILNNSSFGGQSSGMVQPGDAATTPPPTTTAATTTRSTRRVTVTTTWYIYPQWCPYCQRQYSHLRKCLPLIWLSQ